MEQVYCGWSTVASLPLSSIRNRGMSTFCAQQIALNKSMKLERFTVYFNVEMS